MPTIRPHLLTIGAQRVRLAHTSVRHATTLLAGYDLAARLLDPAQPRHPTLILLDLDATELGFSELAAPQLAAVLAHRMHRGDLHPAWLIGLAPGPAPNEDAEAYLAGCHVVLHQPLRETIFARLESLAGQPASLPPTDRATYAYQLAAERVLQAVQAAQITVWTVEEVRVLLGALTRYPVPKAPVSHSKRVLRALGGPERAHQRLHAMAAAWRTQRPLYAEILWQFLDGSERREIVSYFVSRHLYEDSRVYAGIKHLPERIARELQIAQGGAEDT